MYKSLQSKLTTNLGIAFCITGVPLGMYFNFILPMLPWSNFFMFLSILLIVSPRNLSLRNFPSFNKMFLCIMFFQGLMLFYGYLSLEKLTFQYLSFHLYIISLLIALSTNDKRLNYSNVILVTFYISCICSILGLFYLNSGIVTSSEDWELRQTDAYVLDPFTIAIGAIINFLCSLFLLVKRKSRIKLLFWLFIGFDILILFMANKRTPIFVTFVILVLFIYKMGSRSSSNLFKYIKVFILLCITTIFLYSFSELVKNTLNEFVLDFYNGVMNIIGYTNVKDSSGSSILRYKSREWTYNYIDNNFNFFNYIFGVGYMTRWIDNPILQSYLDMGVVGFVLFVYLVVVFPTKSYFKTSNEITLFAMLLCVYNVLSSYSSGNPYLYIKYTPVILLIFVLNLKTNQTERNVKNLF